MDALVRIKNDRVVTDSRTVADAFDKRHDHVLRDIDKVTVKQLRVKETSYRVMQDLKKKRGETT